MARRKNTSVGALIGAALVIAFTLASFRAMLDTAGLVTPVVVIALLIAGVVWFNHAQKQKRTERLLDKYGDEQVVERIMNRNFWEGQTAQQLMDSLENPISINKKAMASRKREV